MSVDDYEQLQAELTDATDDATDCREQLNVAAEENVRLRRQYNELAAAVWCCPVDELEEPHDATIKEAERQPMEIKRLKVETLLRNREWENLVAYLDEQISHWSNRNADRYWQTRRIRGKLRDEEVSDE